MFEEGWGAQCSIISVRLTFNQMRPINDNVKPHESLRLMTYISEVCGEIGIRKSSTNFNYLLVPRLETLKTGDTIQLDLSPVGTMTF